MLMVLKMTETKVDKLPPPTGRWTHKTTLQCQSDLLISNGPSTSHQTVSPTVDVCNVACANKLMMFKSECSINRHSPRKDSTTCNGLTIK